MLGSPAVLGAMKRPLHRGTTLVRGLTNAWLLTAYVTSRDDPPKKGYPLRLQVLDNPHSRDEGHGVLEFFFSLLAYLDLFV